MLYYIYGLYSTEDGLIRYVGQTKSNLKQRRNEHKCDALTRNLKNHKCNWIRSVYRRGYEIEIKLIETVNETNWVEKEIFWINEFSKTRKLVNQLPGGNSGGLGGKLLPYLDYEDAKKYVKENFEHANSIKSYKKEYDEKFDTVSKFVPKTPEHVYYLRGTWKGWGDYLSRDFMTDKEKHDSFKSFNEACLLVRSEHIKTSKEYVDFASKRTDLPMKPNESYRKEWKDWSHFLTGEIKEDKFNYRDFCVYIVSTFGNLMSIDEYKTLHTDNKLDKRCPYHLKRYYKKGIKEIRKDIKRLIV